MRASQSQAIHTALPSSPPSNSPQRRCSCMKASRAASSSGMRSCYSITRSARCRSDGGIVSPRVLAVLRLMTRDREVAGLGALEDLVHIEGATPCGFKEARPIRDQASGHRELPGVSQ